MRRGFVLAAGLMLMALIRVDGQTMTPFFRMDCGPGGSNFPACGWGWVDNSHGALFRRVFVPGGGPQGQDAVDVVLTPTNDGTDTTCDARMGWGGIPVEAPPDQGQSRFVRYRIRYSRANDIRMSPDCGSAWEGKVVIIPNSPDGHRSIEVVSPKGPDGVLSGSVGKNINGPPDGTFPDIAYAANVWHSVQWEVKTSSSSNSSDARYRFWRDNNNNSLPNATSQGPTSLSTTNMGGPMFLQAMKPIALGQSLTIRVCCFEYDDEFDPNWHVDGGPSGAAPAAPRNLRIIPGR